MDGNKILIKNFGPITHFHEEIGDLTILIGPQASGKSTISKLIFFFRSIPDDLLRFLLAEQDFKRALFRFNKQLLVKFVGYFGTTKHMRKFRICYEYSKKKTITLFSDAKGYVQISFNEQLKSEIMSIFRRVRETRRERQEVSPSLLESWDVSLWKVSQKSMVDHMRTAVYAAFEDSKTAIFIPAGRSLVATLADQLQEITPYSTDILMKEFIERINLLKKQFAKSFGEIVQDRKKLSMASIDFPSIELAIRISKKIVKGEYVFSSDGEKIFFNENEYTKLMYSSSGQQEVVFILLLIFTIILEQLEVFIVIEEPEAHLYPSAQKEMVALLTLLLHNPRNRLVITTHSPYILSSFNIHLYAAKLSETLDKRNDKTVDKRLRIPVSKLKAFMVDRQDHAFTYRSIVDEELGLIQSEAIDEASDAINQILDHFIDVEVGE